MAQYKVPQDVEADDKLIGPFSFRQFVYLLIAAGLAAAAVGLFQIFPLLAIIPVPFILLLLALALPLKKDQPMETYLAALVSYYLKPRTRKWTPGQRESTILITAPKIVEDVRTRDLSEEEATHRLSFLADIVDTEGRAIRGPQQSSVREDLVAEANATSDMFDTYQAQNLGQAVVDEQRARHAEAIAGMREAIERADDYGMITEERRSSRTPEIINPRTGEAVHAEPVAPKMAEAVEKAAVVEKPVENSDENDDSDKKVVLNSAKQGIMELANNPDFSVATIAKEANRINRKDDEVFISLH